MKQPRKNLKGRERNLRVFVPSFFNLQITFLYKDKPDEIDMRLITSKFIQVKESRIATIGFH